jgi:hypothetical protein
MGSGLARGTQSRQGERRLTEVALEPFEFHDPSEADEWRVAHGTKGVVEDA